MSESVLITPRRNFLIRALGFTAAGATLSVPIITVADAKARIEHHKAELEKAFRDYYAGLRVQVLGNGKTPDEVWKRRNPCACLMFLASQPDSSDREVDLNAGGQWQSLPPQASDPTGRQ